MFGKLFEKSINLKKFLNDLKRGKGQNNIKEKNKEEVKEKEKIVRSKTQIEGEKSLVFIENYINTTASANEDSTKSQPIVKEEEFKIVVEETPADITLSTEEVVLICDNLLENIVKKLTYMPLSMRYLCKLIEKLTLQLVIESIH